MEVYLRLGVFAGVFFCVAAAEYLWPRRKQLMTRWRRWPHHLGLALLNLLLVRALIPISLTGFAFAMTQQGVGILPLLDLPLFVTVILSVMLLDLVIYAQHVMFHHVPILWRLHCVHHADTEIDVTTALRFHPVEIFISFGIKLAAIAAIGAPPEAVLLFEIILNGCAMFNHGNLRLPLGLDRVMRAIIVTPDMHRVHHSTRKEETNSNYGFNLALWDRLFRTYRAQPALGHENMTIGLEEFRALEEARLARLLTQPFRRSS